MSKKFFVYGTLKVGGHFAVHLDSIRKSMEPANLNGYDLFGVVKKKGSAPSYPAAVKGTGLIKGEVHEFTDDVIALNIMDQIEGYDDRDPKGSYYVRNEVNVTLESGETVTAFVYLFNREIPNFYPKMKEWEI